ncbi:hypothetical protein CEXT_779591, partial [Caerostris extrusa]
MYFESRFRYIVSQVFDTVTDFRFNLDCYRLFKIAFSWNNVLYSSSLINGKSVVDLVVVVDLLVVKIPLYSVSGILPHTHHTYHSSPVLVQIFWFNLKQRTLLCGLLSWKLVLVFQDLGIFHEGMEDVREAQG